MTEMWKSRLAADHPEYRVLPRMRHLSSERLRSSSHRRGVGSTKPGLTRRL
jgi:hypothetical protein